MVFISQESKPLMYLRSRSRLTKQKVCCTNYFENSNVPFRENGARKKKKKEKRKYNIGLEKSQMTGARMHIDTLITTCHQFPFESFRKHLS